MNLIRHNLLYKKRRNFHMEKVIVEVNNQKMFEGTDENEAVKVKKELLENGVDENEIKTITKKVLME
jgi:hypothetical protein